MHSGVSHWASESTSEEGILEEDWASERTKEEGVPWEKAEKAGFTVSDLTTRYVPSLKLDIVGRAYSKPHRDAILWCSSVLDTAQVGTWNLYGVRIQTILHVPWLPKETAAAPTNTSCSWASRISWVSHLNSYCFTARYVHVLAVQWGPQERHKSDNTIILGL